MESALRTLILPVAPRCFWGRAPQLPAPARPYVVLHRISGVRGYHMQGDDGLVQSRVQIDIYGANDGETGESGQAMVRRQADAIIGVLSGYRGGIFRGIFIDSERSLPPEAGDPAELFRLSVDVMVHHTE